MPRLTFERELASLRESLVRMGTLVESQIEAALDALRRRDGAAAEKVRAQDQYLNDLFAQIREQVFMVIATQQPVARDLRYLMGLQYIASELERMGDYAVRIARMTSTLVALPDRPLRAEFGLMGDLAIGQVHDILEAIIDQDVPRAREVASRDNEVDRLWHRVFEELVKEIGEGKTDNDGALRAVTLLLVAHNLERISDRVTNVAEDIVFWKPARWSSWMTRPAGNGSTGRVLVVEDDEGIREMLKYNLSSAGFSVNEASDGERPADRENFKARPDPPRPDAARDERLRLLPRAAKEQPRTDHHDHGQGRRGRQDRRPGAGRRRLHHQTVFDS